MKRPGVLMTSSREIVAFFALLSASPAFASVDVWIVESSLERVTPTQAPGHLTRAEIYAGRGEYQTFQIAIHAGAKELRIRDVSITDLIGPGVISHREISLYREWYVKVKQHSPTWNGPPNLPITTENVFTDALIPFIDPATGAPPIESKYRALPLDLAPGHNGVVWVDVFVPRYAEPGNYTGSYAVTSNEGCFKGEVSVHVWDFTLPLEPSLKSSFNGGGTTVAGVNEELLRNRIMPDAVNPDKALREEERYGLNATDLGFWDGVSYGQCNPSGPPSADVLRRTKARYPQSLLIYDDSGDPESSCTSPSFYKSVIHWAKNLHAAGVENLVTQEPVPELYSDGSPSGRSAVDIWAMLPLAYTDAQSYSPPRVTYVLKKGDKVWSYNDLVQDSYSPKWEIDFLPINYRIQTGFLSQSLELTGILYWSVDDWSADPWTDPQGAQNPDYPGEGVLVYPGAPAGLKGVAPSMRLKYLRDGVQDFEYIQLLKNCGQGASALKESKSVASDWENWTRDGTLLESVRRGLGDQIANSGCARYSIGP